MVQFFELAAIATNPSSNQLAAPWLFNGRQTNEKSCTSVIWNQQSRTYSHFQPLLYLQLLFANNQFKFVRKNLVSLKFSLCVAGNYLETVFCLSWGFFCAHSNDSISSYPPPFLPIFPPAKRSRFDIEAILVFFGKAGWNTYFTLLLEVCDSYGLVFPTPTPPQWCYCVFLLGVFRFIVHPLFYTTDGKKKMAQVQILARTS